MTRQRKAILRIALVTGPVIPVAVWIAYSQARPPSKSETDREMKLRNSLAAYNEINASPSPKNTGTVSAEDKKKLLNLSFNTLKNWTYVEHKTPIPAFIKNLDGQYVQMAGYMMPLNQTEQATEFVLVQFLWGCCYGQPPAIDHVVLVKMLNGQKSRVYSGPVCVRGTFHVGEMREDGYLVSLYRLEAENVVDCQ